jgi:hypothetical protein
LAGAFGLSVPFFPGEFDLAAAVVFALEVRQFAYESVETFGAFVALEVIKGIKVGEQFGGGDAGEALEEIIVAFLLFEGEAFFGDAADEELAFLKFQPIPIAAEPPFGEVLPADGLAGEGLGEDEIDFGELVEPGQERGAEVAVLQSAI